MKDQKMEKLICSTNLENELQIFADDRNWQQYHSPKNLVMALTGEVGELNEIFQWMTEEQSKNAMQDSKVGKHIQEEISDVLLYLIRLASVLNIDLNQAVTDKIALNAKKYPPSKVDLPI